jgi:drug/metabolite transporter (DMT)-like permease
MYAGISLKIASAFVFTVMAGLVRFLDGTIPAGEIVFARNFFALIPVLLWLGWQGNVAQAISTRRVGGHLLRSFAGCTAMFAGFMALGMIPLANATVIGYASPLLTVIFAGVFLKETIRLYRWIAVLIGLGGVMVIVAPGFLAEPAIPRDADTVILGSLLALAGALFTAIAMIQVRRLTQSESTGAIVFFFSCFAALLGLATAPFGWVWPDLETAAVLVGIGVLGGAGQILMTQSYRYADASLIAPFEYTTLLWAIVIGWMAFGDLPDIFILAGGLIVVASGVFVIWRERQLGIERARTREAQSSTPLS